MVLTNSNKFAVIAFGILVLGEARAWQAVLGCVIALAVSRVAPHRTPIDAL